MRINSLAHYWSERTHQIRLGIFIVALLPQLLLFILGYFYVILDERQKLKTVLELGDRQMSSLIRAAEITLEDLQSHLTDSIDETTVDESYVRWLQRIIYDDPRFREVGIVNRTGYLYLTNLGVIDPPVLLPENTRSDPSRKEMQIIGPVTTTVMQ